jgi:LmbE family N-acetylglucosaminyl deacetylase
MAVHPVENLLIPYEAKKEVDCGTALVFAPHADDKVLDYGGAIVRHVADGNPVYVVVVTDDGRNLDNAESGNYILEREQESVAHG